MTLWDDLRLDKWLLWLKLALVLTSLMAFVTLMFVAYLYLILSLVEKLR